MAFGWINPEEFSFNSFLMMERFQIRWMFESRGNDTAWRRNMGLALRANPAVAWYFGRKCPECANAVREIAERAPVHASPEKIREAEVYCLAHSEDFVTYTRPEMMDTSCDFIYGWDENRLHEMADFAGKTVLDVGSGSGRLAFTVTKRAMWVYASEPVDTLREFMRDKMKREGIANMWVVDGMCHALPYPDDTFDIVMHGHAVGNDWDAELDELARVCKPGGWLLSCPGDQPRKQKPCKELMERGWEEMRYKGSFGEDVYRYRKQNCK